MENLVVKITWYKTLFFTMLVQHFIYRSLLHRTRLVCGRLKCSIRYSGFILIRKSKHGKSCKMKIYFIKTAFGTCRQQTKHTKSSKKISQKGLYGLILEAFEIICEMKTENIIFVTHRIFEIRSNITFNYLRGISTDQNFKQGFRSSQDKNR